MRKIVWTLFTVIMLWFTSAAITVASRAGDNPHAMPPEEFHVYYTGSVFTAIVLSVISLLMIRKTYRAYTNK